MKKVTRENIHLPYSLHDVDLVEFVVNGNELIIKVDPGLYKIDKMVTIHKGSILFKEVDWDFCNVYLLNEYGTRGNLKNGEVISLKEFILRYPKLKMNIVDETYGYNKTKLEGDLWIDDKPIECHVDIYHLNDMVYIDEEEY